MAQGRSMAAGVALAAALLGTLAFAGAAGADRPWTWPNTSLGFSCESESADGVVIVEGTANADGSSYVGFWAPGSDPASSPPTLETREPLPTVRDGWRLSGSGEIHDSSTGEPVGDVSYSVEVAPVETETVRDQRKVGNRLYKVRGTTQAIAGEGTAVLPAFTAALEECVGSASDTVLWGTSPRSIQGSGRTGLVDCEVLDADGHRLHLWGDDLNVDGDVYAPTGERVLWSFAHDDTMSMLDAEGLHKTLRVHSEATGEYLGDTVNDLTATSVGRPRTIEQRFEGGRQVLWVEDAVMHGTITFPTGLVFALDGCEVSEIENRRHVSFVPERAGSRADPPNDSVAGAEVLRVGTPRLQAQNGGAAPDAEAASACEAKGDHYGPIGKTLWYSLTGNGSTVMIDTTGSDFDTVVAVYRRDAATGALAEVLCRDDLEVHRFVDVPQAQLVFPTGEGETYYVQVGGFAGESGRLTLAAR